MRRPPLFVLGFLAWLGLELAAFLAVAQTLGLGGALILGLATSFAGIVLLRRTGTGALGHLRSSFKGPPHQPNAMLDSLIGALAAVLLILPGFLSDLAGLALAAPSVRRNLLRRFDGASAIFHPRAREHGVVELAPEEWASIDRPNRR
jgi:UPF0716 protein FxsA